MNNRERAERIVQKYKGQYSLTAAVEDIAAQIDEAVKEERRGWKDAAAAVVRLSSQDARAEGYAAAREQAARLLDERLQQNEIAADLQALPDNKLAKKVQAWMWGVAERIRAMVPPGEGK